MIERAKTSMAVANNLISSFKKMSRNGRGLGLGFGEVWECVGESVSERHPHMVPLWSFLASSATSLPTPELGRQVFSKPQKPALVLVSERRSGPINNVHVGMSAVAESLVEGAWRSMQAFVGFTACLKLWYRLNSIYNAPN